MSKNIQDDSPYLFETDINKLTQQLFTLKNQVYHNNIINYVDNLSDFISQESFIIEHDIENNIIFSTQSFLDKTKEDGESIFENSHKNQYNKFLLTIKPGNTKLLDKLKKDHTVSMWISFINLKEKQSSLIS